MPISKAPPLSDDDDNESTMSSPGHRRFQLRSSSWSALASKIPSKFFLNTKHSELPSSFNQKRKAKRSVTFEDLLGSDEVRQELGLPTKDPRLPGIYREPAPGEFLGHLRPRSEENSRASINEQGEIIAQPKKSIRRHQMRTVSQDDYLLARGANPRTGIISPGVVTPGHSLESSLGEQEALEARAAAGESKWRLNGDQWISLGLDQPTPTGSPPKLDAFGLIPLQRKIHRKPVGSPPRRNREDRERSSSAPTPRKFKYFQPVDVGKDMSDTPQKPFLGQLMGRQILDVPETSLRCRPTNNIQFQSPLSNQTKMRTPTPGRLPVRMQKTSGPRTADPSYPHLRYHRPEIPLRRYHLIPELQAGQMTGRNPKNVGDQRDIRIVHPHFQPHSLRGVISGPREMVMQGCSQRQHLANDIHTTQPNTISMSTDTRTPSSTSNKQFRNERKPSENISLPMNRSRMKGVTRPHMPGRSEEMIDVPKVSLQPPHRHQLSQTGTKGGTASTISTPEDEADYNRCVPKKVTHFHTSSFEDKLRNMPGSIRIFDGPAEAEAEIGNETGPFPAATGNESPRHAIAAARRAMGYDYCLTSLVGNEAASPEEAGSDTARFDVADSKRAMGSRDRVLSFDGSGAACLDLVRSETPQHAFTTLTRAGSIRDRMLGLEESAVAYLEPILMGLLGRLGGMAHCIVGTMRKVLRTTYVYSETGKMEIDGVLVVEVLRSMIYTLILGAIAMALAKVIKLVVRVGACIVWMFKGFLWVLMAV